MVLKMTRLWLLSQSKFQLSEAIQHHAPSPKNILEPTLMMQRTRKTNSWSFSAGKHLTAHNHHAPPPPPPPTVHFKPNFLTFPQRLTKLLLIGQVGHKDSQKHCWTAVPSAPTQSNFADNAHLSITSQYNPFPWIQTSPQPAQDTSPLRNQLLHKISKISHLQNNDYIPGFLDCGKP